MTTGRGAEGSLAKCDDAHCVLPDPHEGLCTQKAPVVIDYTNWKGKRRKRRVSPTGQMMHTSSEFHPEPQWLFGAIDHEDGKHKLFAYTGLHLWEEVKSDA